MSSRLKGTNERKPARRGGLSSWEKIVIPIILILVIWGAYSFSQPTHGTSVSQTSSTSSTAISTSSKTGAPDFTLPTVDANGLTGQRASLSSFRGKVVLLEFMEPWCPHCQNMAPVLENLYKQFGSQNVVFISVAGPIQGATSGDTARFIQTYGSSWTYLYDSSGTTMSAYGVTATPTFFIIGKDGSILTTLQGEQSYDTLANALTQVSG
jgi:cytochrome c-type biogenesis protein